MEKLTKIQIRTLTKLGLIVFITTVAIMAGHLFCFNNEDVFLAKLATINLIIANIGGALSALFILIVYCQTNRRSFYYGDFLFFLTLLTVFVLLLYDSWYFHWISNFWR